MKISLHIDVKLENPYNYCNLRKIIFYQYLPRFVGIMNQMGARFDRLRYWNYSSFFFRDFSCRRLQQCLPFTVLKLYITIEHTHTVFISCNSTCRLRYWNIVLIVNTACNTVMMLQQCLPLAVLKQKEEVKEDPKSEARCNSTYRLRYWNSE